MCRGARGIRARGLILSRRGSLLGLFVLDVRFMMSDHAAGRRTRDRVMTRHVADDGADRGSFEATFGTSNAGQRCQRRSEGNGS